MFSSQLNAFIETCKLHKTAYTFIKENRIWEGLFKSKWVIIIGVILSVIVTWCFVAGVIDFMNPGEDEPTQNRSGLMGFINYSNDHFINGTPRYAFLLLIEIVIFHCTVKTLNILRNEHKEPGLNDFVSAEKRMFLVVLRTAILEWLTITFLKIFLPSFFLGFLVTPLAFLIQCYYLGFAFMDNYNEQFGLTIKQSAAQNRKHIGASISIGLVAYLLLFVPLVGFLIVPILGAVTASIYSYRYKLNTDKERSFHPQTT